MKDAWRDLSCPTCRGTGVYNERKAIRCLKCHGTGRISIEDKDDP